MNTQHNQPDNNNKHTLFVSNNLKQGLYHAEIVHINNLSQLIHVFHQKVSMKEYKIQIYSPSTPGPP